MLQQTPRSTIREPPSDVTFPPLIAVVEVIADIWAVTTARAAGLLASEDFLLQAIKIRRKQVARKAGRTSL